MTTRQEPLQEKKAIRKGRVLDLIEQLQEFPELDSRSAEEILGYDEIGCFGQGTPDVPPDAARD